MPKEKDEEKEKHIHRFLPSGNPVRCAWRCICGDYFIACGCGTCLH